MENTVGQVQNLQGTDSPKVTIQIINPSVVTPGGTVPAPNINAQNYNTNPVYPANYYTKNFTEPQPDPQPQLKIEAEAETKNTEKPETIPIPNDIESLKAHLSDKKHKGRRLMGAHGVIAKLQEGPDKKDEAELNALINKMLEDKHETVKFLAMAALESGDAKGNKETVQILQKIQHNESEDIIDQENSRKASGILTKMSGKTV